MKRTLTIGLIMIFASAMGQVDKNLIYGKWTGAKRTLKNGETGEKLTFDGKPYKNDWKLEFRKDGKSIDLVETMTFDFKVTGDLLLIGDRKYKIEKLTKTLIGD